ncbi:MAG: pyrroloquinoline quinone biosynthesis peptide chaperone PqqD [Xanthomonadales bacterium]|nr:pyrroloquinoline quinone biosynthesis peptide chaperone PqqD [Xanthomonadales bacterium]
MNEALAPDIVPRLARGVRMHADRQRGATMLLAPERALKLDPVAAAIVSEINGERSFYEIVDRLAATFDAPRDRIEQDVRDLLADMARRGLVELP